MGFLDWLRGYFPKGRESSSGNNVMNSDERKYLDGLKRSILGSPGNSTDAKVDYVRYIDALKARDVSVDGDYSGFYTLFRQELGKAGKLEKEVEKGGKGEGPGLGSSPRKVGGGLPKPLGRKPKE